MENNSLYIDNDVYRVLTFGNRDQWLKGRMTGIGGSDASACMNRNRWKNARDLWAIKTCRQEPADISGSPAVIYGHRKEPQIRADFELDFEDTYKMQYVDNVTLQNIEHPYMLYSPDGLLIEKATGRKGIFEAKTHQIHDSNDWKAWREGIGYEEYFIQVLHGLNVTGFDFVCLRAELKRSPIYKQVRTYIFDIDDDGIRESAQIVFEEVKNFWEEYIEKDIEPPVIKYL